MESQYLLISFLETSLFLIDERFFFLLLERMGGTPQMDCLRLIKCVLSLVDEMIIIY